MGETLSEQTDQSSPAVTVIVPVYQTRAFLRECLDSVCGQSLRELQIIVVDDASTDGSIAIAEALANKDKRIQILRHTLNRGPSAARNAGLHMASADYVFFLDSDDYIATDALAKLLAAAKRTAADVSFCRGQLFTEDGEFGQAFPRKNLHDAEALDPQRFTNQWVFMSAFLGLYNRRFLTRHRLAFDEDLRLGEDRTFLASCLPKARAISVVAEELYFYRRREGSLSNYDELDCARMEEFILYSQRVSAKLARLPMVRQHYLLAFINASIARLVAVAHRGDKDALKRLAEGMAGVYKGLDIDLLRCPEHQQWRPASVLPPRYRAVAEALAEGDALRLCEAVSELAAFPDTARVVEARQLLANEPDASLRLAREELQRDAENPQACLLFGEALLRSYRQPHRCVKVLAKAVKLAPDDPEAHRALSMAHLRQGRLVETEADIARALNLCSCEGRYVRAKSRIALARGDIAGAISAMRMEMELLPGSPNPNISLARTCFDAGDIEAACRALQSMWENKPNLQRKKLKYWRLVASMLAKGVTAPVMRALLDCGEPQASARALHHVLAAQLDDELRQLADGESQHTGRIDLGDCLARLHARLGASREWSTARAAAEAEVLCLPDTETKARRAAAQCRLAMSCERVGDIWAAMRAVRFAHKLSPGRGPIGTVAYRISLRLEKLGELEEAIECARIWQQRQPLRLEIQARIDDLHSRLNNPGPLS